MWLGEHAVLINCHKKIGVLLKTFTMDQPLTCVVVDRYRAISLSLNLSISLSLSLSFVYFILYISHRCFTKVFCGTPSGTILCISLVDGYLSLSLSFIYIYIYIWLSHLSLSLSLSLMYLSLSLSRSVTEIVGHTMEIYSLVLSPCGTLLASASADGSVKVR